MFKIGEFSRLVRVSARMLRHYEKCGLLYPAKIDVMTGYRFYSAGQMPLLSRIVDLRDMGFSIVEIGDMLQHIEDESYLEKAFLGQKQHLEAVVAAEQAKLARLSALKDWMKKERYKMVYDVEIKELPGMNVLALRDTIPNYAAEGMLWQRLGQYAAQNGITPPEGICGYTIFWDEEYKESNVDIEIAIPIGAPGQGGGGVTYRKLERVELSAAVKFSGPYDSFGPAAEKLAAWIEVNGYEITGPMRSVTIRGPHSESDPVNYLTELQMPVAKK